MGVLEITLNYKVQQVMVNIICSLVLMAKPLLKKLLKKEAETNNFLLIR